MDTLQDFNIYLSSKEYAFLISQKKLINSTENLHQTLESTINSEIWICTRFFISNLGFCLELGLFNSETKIGTGVA